MLIGWLLAFLLHGCECGCWCWFWHRYHDRRHRRQQQREQFEQRKAAWAVKEQVK